MFYLNILKNSIKYFIKVKKGKQSPPIGSAFTMDTGLCRHKHIIGILLQSVIDWSRWIQACVDTSTLLEFGFKV